jgi:hypothetical protein
VTFTLDSGLCATLYLMFWLTPTSWRQNWMGPRFSPHTLYFKENRFNTQTDSLCSGKSALSVDEHVSSRYCAAIFCTEAYTSESRRDPPLTRVFSPDERDSSWHVLRHTLLMEDSFNHTKGFVPFTAMAVKVRLPLKRHE